MTKSKKHTIAKKLEEIFSVPFTELINKHFQKGASRYEIQRRLLEMIVEYGLSEKATKIFVKKEGSKIIRITDGKWDLSKWEHDKFGAVSVSSNPAFRPSTLYNAIKDARNAGDSLFDFSTSNKGRKSGTVHKYSTLNIELVCRSCGVRHKNNGITDINDLSLKIYQCPKCGLFGKCVAKIVYGGKTTYKAVVKINGIRQETEVISENDLTPVNEETPGYREEEECIVKV